MARKTHRQLAAEVLTALEEHLASGHRCPGVPHATCYQVICRRAGCTVTRGLAWGADHQPNAARDREREA